MINNISSFSNNSFCGALKDLSFGRLLNSCGFNKKRGVPILIVMYGLLTAVFNYSGIHQKTQSRKGYSQCNCTDQVFYDITSNPKLNWRKLCLLLALKLIRKIAPTMTCAKCFVLDDTIMERPRSKKVELLSRTYDHVSHRQVKGFTNLLLAWTDGLSSVPVINAVVSSSKIICPERNDIDKRTNGAKRRKEAQEKKTILAVKLIKEALNAGIIASYVLMDSWFTEVPLISAVRKLNLHVIGMVKLSQKRFYTYQEKQYTLQQLRKKIKSASRHSNILGSLQVKLKTGIKAKLVYVVNYNNRKQFLVILSTDLTLSDEEIVQTYGKRFNIEQIFKSMKHLLKLTKENQGRSFDSTIAFSSLSIIRVIAMEWIRRTESDPATMGSIFNNVKDTLEDLPFTVALQTLLQRFFSLPDKLAAAGAIKQGCIDTVKAIVENEINSWFDDISDFIRDFCLRFTNDRITYDQVNDKINISF